MKADPIARAPRARMDAHCWDPGLHAADHGHATAFTVLKTVGFIHPKAWSQRERGARSHIALDRDYIFCSQKVLTFHDCSKFLLKFMIFHDGRVHPPEGVVAESAGHALMLRLTECPQTRRRAADAASFYNPSFFITPPFDYGQRSARLGEKRECAD